MIGATSVRVFLVDLGTSDLLPALLSALTYGWAKEKSERPLPEYERMLTEPTDFIRASTDLIHFIFVYDEYTDKMNKADAQTIADICMDAMRNPSTPRPSGEHLLGEMARQYVQYSSSISRAPLTPLSLQGFSCV